MRMIANTNPTEPPITMGKLFLIQVSIFVNDEGPLGLGGGAFPQNLLIWGFELFPQV